MRERVIAEATEGLGPLRTGELRTNGFTENRSPRPPRRPWSWMFRNEIRVIIGGGDGNFFEIELGNFVLLFNDRIAGTGIP